MNRPPLVALRVYYFVGYGAFGLYLPHFANWLAGHGFVGAKMSVLMALLPLMSLLSPPILGVLADRLGLRRQLMTLCAATTATGLTMLGLLAWSFESLPFLPALAAMLVFATLRAPVNGLADVVALETAADYGRMRVWGSLGFLTTAWLGSRFVSPAHPYALPFAIAGGLWLQTIVSLFLPQGEKLPPRPALSDARQLVAQVGFRRLLLTIGLIFGGSSAYDLCLSLRLRSLGASDQEVGLFWAVATLAEVALMFSLAPVLRKISPARLLSYSCLMASARWVYLADATDLRQMLLLQPLHAISFGMMWLSAIETLKRETGSQGMATAQGLFAACVAIGGTLGMGTWGIVYDSFGSRTVFLCAAALGLLAASAAARLVVPRQKACAAPV